MNNQQFTKAPCDATANYQGSNEVAALSFLRGEWKLERMS